MSASGRPRDVNYLLICCRSGVSLQVLFCLAALGGSVHVMGTPNTAAVGRSRHSRTFTQVDDGQALPGAWAARVNAIAAARRIDIVIPGDPEAAYLVIAMRKLISVLTYPLPTMATFEELADKWRFHEFCTRLALPVPRAMQVAGKAALDPSTLEREIGYPMVIKPTDQSNALGVVVLRNPSDLRGKVIDNPNYRFDNLIAQEFLPGADIDCSVLATGGRVVSAAVQRRVGRATVFGGCAPLLDASVRVAEASALDGVAHFDARIDDTGNIKFVECNPRFWRSISAARWCGMNFVSDGIAVALGTADVTHRRILDKGAFLQPGAFIGALTQLRFDQPGLTWASLRGAAAALADIPAYIASERKTASLTQSTGGPFAADQPSMS